MVSCRRMPLVAVGLVALLAPSTAAAAKGEGEAAPDLVVTKVSKPPASAVVGSKITVVVKLRNKGAAKAGKSRVALYLAKGKKHKAKDRRLKQAKVKALQPGTKTKAKLKITLPGNASAGTYRLIACADDTRKVRESKEGNCTRTKKFSLTLPVPGGPPTAAFSMTDEFAWGFVSDPTGKKGMVAGQPITATLHAANGIAGAAGYSRSSLPPQPLLAGAATAVEFAGDQDENSATRRLPFAFPFGGISETSINVSTNGWAGFGGSPTPARFSFSARDYRGVNLVIGEFERGIMPYWAELTLEDEGGGAGTVKEVIAPDGSYIAFQWDVNQVASPNGERRRVLQLVLFPDGRFRMDYPGANEAGGERAFVGYSLGTGPGSVDVVASSVKAVPSESLLFTPNPLPAGRGIPAGEATLTLPAGSSVISANPACALTLAAGAFSEGRVSCQMPSLAVGQEVARAITFAAPPDAPGQFVPANFRYRGTYAAGGSTLTDGDEINPLGSLMTAESVDVEVGYTGSNPPKANTPAEFRVDLKAQAGTLDEPMVTLRLPANSTLASILIAGQVIPCGALEGGRITCRLPSGLSETAVNVKVVPTTAAIGSKLSLEATGQALNAPPKSVTATSAEAVVP